MTVRVGTRVGEVGVGVREWEAVRECEGDGGFVAVEVTVFDGVDDIVSEPVDEVDDETVRISEMDGDAVTDGETVCEATEGVTVTDWVELCNGEADEDYVNDDDSHGDVDSDDDDDTECTVIVRVLDAVRVSSSVSVADAVCVAAAVEEAVRKTVVVEVDVRLLDVDADADADDPCGGGDGEADARALTVRDDGFVTDGGRVDVGHPAMPHHRACTVSPSSRDGDHAHGSHHRACR